MNKGSTVAVIDYGMGNLHSAAKALEHADPAVKVSVTCDPSAILAADRVVLPGVGAMRDCMAEIKRLGVDKVVRDVVESGKPLLGICVGMQSLVDFSEENNGVDCLGIMPGQVKFFGNDLCEANGERLKVPHMGWNTVEHSGHPLWEGIAQGTRFYFVHSYYVTVEDEDEIAARCHYGKDFIAAITRGNVFAVQFHPEKSHTAGLQLLANFLRWDGKA